MSNQSGHRVVDSVLSARYWLTEQGEAATDEWWAERQQDALITRERRHQWKALMEEATARGIDWDEPVA